MIPTGLGRIGLIVAIAALVAYLITGEGDFAFLFLFALAFLGLHWAYSGGWGPNSYGSRPEISGEPTIGGQPGSASQWVWYVVGVIGLLLIGFLMLVVIGESLDT